DLDRILLELASRAQRVVAEARSHADGLRADVSAPWDGLAFRAEGDARARVALGLAAQELALARGLPLARAQVVALERWLARPGAGSLPLRGALQAMRSDGRVWIGAPLALDVPLALPLPGEASHEPWPGTIAAVLLSPTAISVTLARARRDRRVALL